MQNINIRTDDLCILDYNSQINTYTLVRKQISQINKFVLKDSNPKIIRFLSVADDVFPEISNIRQKDWYIKYIKSNPYFFNKLEDWEIIVHDIMINKSITYRELYQLKYYDICRSLILRGNILDYHITEEDTYFIKSVINLISYNDYKRLHIIIDSLIKGYDIITTAILINADMMYQEYEYLTSITPKISNELRICCILNLSYHLKSYEIIKTIEKAYIENNFTSIIPLYDIQNIIRENKNNNELYILKQLYEQKRIYTLIDNSFMNNEYNSMVYQSPNGYIVIKACQKKECIKFVSRKLSNYIKLTGYPMEVLLKIGDTKYKKCGVIFKGDIFDKGKGIYKGAVYCGIKADENINKYINNLIIHNIINYLVEEERM